MGGQVGQRQRQRQRQNTFLPPSMTLVSQAGPAIVPRPSMVHARGACLSQTLPTKPLPAPFSRGDSFRQDSRYIVVIYDKKDRYKVPGTGTKTEKTGTRYNVHCTYLQYMTLKIMSQIISDGRNPPPAGPYIEIIYKFKVLIITIDMTLSFTCRTVDVHPARWSASPRPDGPSVPPQENSTLERGKLLGWDQVSM